MATITSQNIITITDALAVTTTTDITLLAANSGSNARRELHYPSDTLPPIVYDKNPDTWTNFDTSPLVKRPSVAVQPTIQGNRLVAWKGFDRDRPVVETWQGSSSESPMTLSFFRELASYYLNPPTADYIQWKPKDRTVTVYNIIIENLTLGGQDFTFDYVPTRNGYLTGDVQLTFRIIGEV